MGSASSSAASVSGVIEDYRCYRVSTRNSRCLDDGTLQLIHSPFHYQLHHGQALLRHLMAIVCFTDVAVATGTYFRSFSYPLVPGYAYVAVVEEVVPPVNNEYMAAHLPHLQRGDVVAVMLSHGAWQSHSVVDINHPKHGLIKLPVPLSHTLFSSFSSSASSSSSSSSSQSSSSSSSDVPAVAPSSSSACTAIDTTNNTTANAATVASALSISLSSASSSSSTATTIATAAPTSTASTTTTTVPTSTTTTTTNTTPSACSSSSSSSPSPRHIDAGVAPARILNGTTAYELIHRAKTPSFLSSLHQRQHTSAAGDRDREEESINILVHAGAGAVGSYLLYLLQQLKLPHVRVFATCSASKAEHVRKLGAIPIDYKRTDMEWTMSVREACGGRERPLRLIFDGIGPTCFAKDVTLLSDHGRLVMYGTTDGSSFARVVPYLGMNVNPFCSLSSTFFGIALYRESEPAHFASDYLRLLELAMNHNDESPTFFPMIMERMTYIPFEQVVSALQRVRDGKTVGSTVVIIDRHLLHYYERHPNFKPTFTAD